MSSSTYLYDQGWRSERERLAGIEAMWDPGSRSLIGRLGITQGWRCLEVGGGGGALTEWMCERVGPAGRVLATDLDTRFLEAIESPALEVRRHDIVNDVPPDERFDLIHSRMVLEHIPQRDEVLEGLASLLAPGGALLIEDYDMASAGVEPPSPDFDKVRDALLGLMADVGGHDAAYGRRLVRELRRVGLEDVDAEGRALVVDADSPGTAFFRLSIDAVRGPLVERGDLTEAEIDEAIANFDNPDMTLITPTQFAAWGRAPA